MNEITNSLEIIKKEQPALEKILALNARPGADLATIVAQEIMYFELISVTRPEILKCTPQSILLAVRDVMKKNLTLDPSAGLVYIKTRGVNLGTYDRPNWISVLDITPTVNGLISYYRQLGRILDYTYPEIKKDSTGKVIEVSMQLLLPSYGKPRWEKRTFDESDFMRWRKASHKENGRSWKANTGKPQPNDAELNYANPNYTNFKNGIDPEFARAKCIRHSLKKLGANQQESSSIKVYDVPAERIVDPEKDEYEYQNSNDEYAQHIEISTELNDTPPTTEELPSVNDL